MNVYIHCGEKDSIKYTFIDCIFTKTFVQNVVQWFNETTLCQIFPIIEEVLFGIISDTQEKRMKRKFNYTTPFMRLFIYSGKLNNKAISFQEFTDKLLLKHNLENIHVMAIMQVAFFFQTV